MQVFSRPTYDRIAKHVLSQDESVRLDILKAFTGMDDIISARQLDDHYNPFDPLHHLRSVVNDAGTESLFRGISEAEAVEVTLDGKKAERGGGVLKLLGNLYGDLRHTFPSWRNRSTVDFLCDTPVGYVTVEFQVVRQEYWDKRALAYIASIYGNQLRQNQGYGDLKDVIGVNLLGDGSTPYWRDGSFIRDYRFADRLNPKNVLHPLRLVQYSLGDVRFDDPVLRENERLRQWIEFFKSAHEKDAVPPSVAPPVRKAYEMVRVDILKKEHPELLKASDEFFASLTEHDRAVKEAGMAEAKAQIARKMLAAGKFSDGDICDLSGVSLDELRSLKREGGV